MWKVLLVEDETRVRRMVKEIVDWEEMGFCYRWRSLQRG